MSVPLPLRLTLERLWLALLGAALLVVAEFLVVALLFRREIASVWELQRGGFLLAPSAFVFVLLAAVVGGVLHGLFERAARRPERAMLSLLLSLWAGAVGFGVGGGRHLADPALRVCFALGIALSAGFVTFRLAPALSRRAAAQPRLAALSLIVALVLLEFANQLVLPRLYPAFHIGLSALSLMLAPSVILCLPREPNRKAAPLGLLSLLVAVGLSLLLVPSARALARFDNFRFVLLEKAPILRHAIELAARIAPPLAWDSNDDCSSLDGVGCAQAAPLAGSKPAQALDLRGRDFLLISVDALRADHVGAYGYTRPTTPNLDRLAEDGALFAAAYTATPHTSYAVTSLLTGKYMRPLLLQGAGTDSDTWASLLRTYGYRTAAFFPPAVFFIDTQKFEPFQRNQLGFEYAKIEFAEGEKRIGQVNEYLRSAGKEQPLFVWVHLFGPHEPYVAHPEHAFGERDLDRYDSEIADADATLGAIVGEFRARRPNGVVVVTADHGEEFGEHGGRYHGTSVYEEQARVPLIISAPGAIPRARISEVVQTIDILPTVLSGLGIPTPPRVRGRDLGAVIAGARPETPGFAYAETDEFTLLAEGNARLVCARRIGACKLYDLSQDRAQTRDLLGERREEAERLRKRLREINDSHGRYESSGLRAENKGWPAPILRGLAGEGDAAPEIGSLLDDVDPVIRRKAAEVLFELGRAESAPQLRLALGRDDDGDVRRFAALALTRLGEGAPSVVEMLGESDPRLRRLAALALAEGGDGRGATILLEWWRDANARDFGRSREILAALGNLRYRDAIPFLIPALADVRLRPYVARTLAKIGDESARVPLARAFADERAQNARLEIGRAMVALGAREEMAMPLIRFLGVPDPLSEGLALAQKAHILQLVGGPGEKDLPRMRSRSEIGTRVRFVIPAGARDKGVRALVRASCPRSETPATIVLGGTGHLVRYDRAGKLLPERGVPAIDERAALRLSLPCEGRELELYGTLPEILGLRPGQSSELILFASRGVTVEALAVVPLADELPPPPPKPWSPEAPGG